MLPVGLGSRNQVERMPHLDRTEGIAPRAIARAELTKRTTVGEAMTVCLLAGQLARVERAAFVGELNGVETHAVLDPLLGVERQVQIALGAWTSR